MFIDVKRMGCNIQIQYLWIIYVAALIVLGLVFGAIVYKSSGLGCSCAVLLSTVLSALIVYLIAAFNVNPHDLSSGEKSSLNALYITMLVLIVLAFFFCIIELALKGGKYAKDKLGSHVHVKAECSPDTGECEVKNVVVCEKTETGKAVINMDCSGGECSPTNMFLKDRSGSTLSIQYLA